LIYKCGGIDKRTIEKFEKVSRLSYVFRLLRQTRSIASASYVFLAYGGAFFGWWGCANFLRASACLVSASPTMTHSNTHQQPPGLFDITVVHHGVQKYRQPPGLFDIVV
jgi:hypothetical protein